MKISVTSGKGGVGKTSIAVLLAYSLKDACYIDCDVEEPNGRLFLKPKIEKSIEYSELIPKIDENICIFCEKCADACVYKALIVSKAIHKTMFFKDLCHSCGVCSYVCPVENALVEIPARNGVINFGKAGELQFVEGKLDIGQPSATPLIRGLKKYIDNDKINIVDTAPGVSCPVVEAIEDSDYVILVTEPTPFGLSDLKLSVELVRKLKLKFGILINRYENNFSIIDHYADYEKIDVIYKMPYSLEFMQSYSRGNIPFEKYMDDFYDIFSKIKDNML